jgi:hypothetical protein
VNVANAVQDAQKMPGHYWSGFEYTESTYMYVAGFLMALPLARSQELECRYVIYRTSLIAVTI